MPIHDWTKVPAGLFHHFHQDWSIELARALNRGGLPAGYSALVEQRMGGPEPDVIAVERRGNRSRDEGQLAVMEPPRAWVVQRLADEAGQYAEKANRISIRHALGDVVAVIEIVSPGNKSSRAGIRMFIEKSAALLKAGVHLLVIDLFPPSPRDPQGIHPLIVSEFNDEPFELPDDAPLTLVSYQATDEITAYLEPMAVGQKLPDMPLFIASETHVPTPLEATYQTTWEACPVDVRDLVQ